MSNENEAAATSQVTEALSGCPFFAKKASNTVVQDDSAEAKSSDLHYNNYLQLEKILNAQAPVTLKHNVYAHDEHLFIIIHQAYELWFKQIIYELDSIMNILEKQMVDDRSTLMVVQRIQRVNSIWKLLIDQISILDTMAPTDFLDFRDYLAGASGFQSLQFRLIENKLGLNESLRIKYNQRGYEIAFANDASSLQLIKQSLAGAPVVRLVEAWLERTPCLIKQSLDDHGKRYEQNYFLDEFRKGFDIYIYETFVRPYENETNEAKKKELLDELKSTTDSFATLFDKEKHDKLVERGERKLSHKALWGALMIWLNRDEPRFHLPYQLLILLIDLDSLINRWRYHHALLTQRQIGSKTGTGGSSGYSYLRSTATDRYKIFNDLVGLSTWLIPKKYLPQLTDDVRKRLNSFSNPE